LWLEPRVCWSSRIRRARRTFKSSKEKYFDWGDGLQLGQWLKDNVRNRNSMDAGSRLRLEQLKEWSPTGDAEKSGNDVEEQFFCSKAISDNHGHCLILISHYEQTIALFRPRNGELNGGLCTGVRQTECSDDASV
jgi:hypothetical protein